MTEQEMMRTIGNCGCYLLCLKHIAEKYKKRHIEIKLEDFEIWLHYSWIDSECFIFKPEELLRYWTNRKWEVRKEKAIYEKKPNEEVIECWTRGTSTHFCMADYGKENSITVKNGGIESVRVASMV